MNTQKTKEHINRSEENVLEALEAKRSDMKSERSTPPFPRINPAIKYRGIAVPTIKANK